MRVYGGLPVAWKKGGIQLNRRKTIRASVRRAGGKNPKSRAALRPSPVSDDVEKERRTLKVLEGIVREKEELLRHHEDKVIQLKSDYEKKLKSLAEKEGELERRSSEIKSAEHASRDLLGRKGRLEADCRKLGQEESILKDSVAGLRKGIGELHGEHARRQADVLKMHEKHSSLQKEFDKAYERASKVDAYYRAREAELSQANQALAEATQKHERILAQITYHSSREIRNCIKKAYECIRKRLFEQALLEYERIRKFYSYLSPDEKKRLYRQIAGVRQKLSHQDGWK